MASLKSAIYHGRELTKLPYPPLVEMHRYVVTRGGYKNFQKLYVGTSHDVARLIVNTMKGAKVS